MQFIPAFCKAAEIGIGLTAIAALILARCGGGGRISDSGSAAATASITPFNRVFGHLFLAGLCLLSVSTADAAGDAANGKVLYNTTNGAPLACSSCHGANPSSGMNKILNGANNGARIMSAISSNVGGMGFLLNYISTAQADDVGAYIANPNATTTAPVPVATASPTSLLMEQGWNLLGNNLNQPINAASQFTDQNIASVWKWDAATAGWQFYTPSLTTTALETYAASKGFGILSQINPGEGYWVNAKARITLPVQTGTSLVASAALIQTPPNVGASVSAATASPPSLLMGPGWNLLGNNLNQPLTAALQFNDQNIESVWKWDIATTGWQLYTPLLTAAALQAYTASKGFGMLNQINPGEGYWVNAKARITLPVQINASPNSAAAIPQTPTSGVHEGSEHEGAGHEGGEHEGSEHEGGHDGGEHEGIR